ncbi:SusE outer membrane protein [Hyunsoonleella jejuensis]|uniref:SusE outer membrane protein n=1 Tax=Hyunsoonleella jejuensis TaxID=419940 RepID=A0A1H9L3E9_9FLAO|nr:SusE domain-containing protein [Hyunsoonleella jejuensis]SER05906.1 SusE outer membrane protein [Hyunsoonleella jejuensis]
MKRLVKKLLFLVSVTLVVLACETENNLQPEGLWELSNPTIALPSDDLIVLDETTPNNIITFGWEPATSSANYIVSYKVVVDTLGSSSFDTPILELTPSNSGKDLSASVSYQAIDEALSFAGYPANTNVELTWAVIASSINKTSSDVKDITIKRFENEIIPDRLFMSGTATENNNNLSEAIPLRRLNDSNGEPSNVYEIYTSLKAGSTFKFFSEQSLPALVYGGGATEGSIEKSGAPISVAQDGQYRVKIDLDNSTYSLLKIERWNMKGSPIIGGWGSDEPLEYIGAGVWQASIQLVSTGGFLFRADVDGSGYWDHLLKRVVGTTNTLIMESDAGNQGVSFEDIPSEQLGTLLVTLNLSANAYTYTIEKDPNAAEPIETPNSLYLFNNNTLVGELTKDGDVFRTDNYIALQSGDQITLNTASDASGDSFTAFEAIGATDAPDGINVSESPNLSEATGAINVERDQAYKFTIDFANAKLQWNYYNIFLFHWDEINQKWDDRNEFLMTYQHPYKFTTTVSLSANFDMKFISPWDNDFGSESPTDLSGNLTNKGGSNIRNIDNDGNYQVNIEIAPDFSAGTYEYIRQ